MTRLTPPFVLQHYHDKGPINIGVGKDHPVREIAEVVKRVVGYEGEMVFDTGKPDGAPQKLLDVSKLTALGWRASTELEAGVAQAYNDYLNAPQ